QLDRKRGEEQEVVARQPLLVRPPQPRRHDQRQHRAAEQACPGLFKAEDEKLDRRARQAPRRPPVEHRVGGGVDPGFERCEAPQACCASTIAARKAVRLSVTKSTSSVWSGSRSQISENVGSKLLGTISTVVMPSALGTARLRARSSNITAF